MFTVAGFNDAVFRFPTAVALVLGYFIGFVFMETYSVTVHTVVCCFCEDEKYNDGSLEYPYFMQGSLEAVLGPAAEFGRATDKTKGDIKNKKAEFAKEIVALKRRQTMDKKERSEADGGKSKDGDDDNFDAERQALQNKANEDVKVMMIEQDKKLKKLAEDTALKKRNLLKGAPSKRVSSGHGHTLVLVCPGGLIGESHTTHTD